MNSLHPHFGEQIKPSEEIVKKVSTTDGRIKVLILTENSYKMKEYNTELGQGYGVGLFYKSPPAFLTDATVRKILAEMDPSPYFILREESQLLDALTKNELSGIAIVENPEKAPKFVLNRSSLSVWIPQWDKQGVFQGFNTKEYTHEIKGRIDPLLKDEKREDTFGWDHLFVNPQTSLSHLNAMTTLWGKTSARQMVLGDFIANHLFYGKPQALSYHKELNPEKSIEFSKEMSVGNFVRKNPFLNNPNLSLWGLSNIRDHILNEGVFFKAATSRPIKNYFSPPFGGVPLTSKKTDVEETVFMMHDLNHHNIPDLIFEGDASEEMRNVYVAWRMMSEAMTLVIADMLYADTLVKTNPENEKKVDSRIYPLFKSLNLNSLASRDEIIRELLWANTQYAVIGNDEEWKKLIQPGHMDKLEAYKNHFEKFFVGDHVWTEGNFRNMSKMKDCYTFWINTVGRSQFAQAGLLFLSDITAKIKNRGADLLSFESVVSYVFEEIFETRILAHLQNPEVVVEEQRNSRAFQRYMIGQMSFYAHFHHLNGMVEKAKHLAEKLKEITFFDEESRHRIYNQFEQDVSYVWSMGVMTGATADYYRQIHPIFPPFYINYSKQECKTVKEVLQRLYGKS